jgi:hypothetical protein
MCVLAGVVSRAGYYRRWQASAPRQEEIAVRDAIQRVVLANRRMAFGGSPERCTTRAMTDASGLAAVSQRIHQQGECRSGLPTRKIEMVN